MKINKKILIGLGILNLMTSCIVMIPDEGINNSGSKTTSNERYSCSKLKDEIRVEYFNNGDRIRLTDDRGDTYDMKRASSGSGIYYTDGRDSFHTDGREAILELNKREYNCHRIK